MFASQDLSSQALYRQTARQHSISQLPSNRYAVVGLPNGDEIIVYADGQVERYDANSDTCTALIAPPF